MSEPQSDYLTEDQRVILARLMDVFTAGQLLALTEAMSEAQERHYGRVEIELRNGRVFIWSGRSRDCGKVKNGSPIA